MAEEKAQERTEQATPRRLRQAREKGQIARSRELNTMVLLLAGSGGLLLMGATLAEGLSHILQTSLSLDRAQVMDSGFMTRQLSSVMVHALLILTPYFLLLVVAAILAPMALGGWSFSTKSLAFNWGKLDPIKGLGKLFSPRALMELSKALVKFALVLVVATTLIVYMINSILGLSQEPTQQALAHASSILVWSFIALSFGLIAIVLVDVPFQLWDHSKQLKMTRQEVKDDQKETDGDPQVKGRIRNVQRELAQRRMMAEVPKADVIVTNPTHFAIALRYAPESMSTPVVIAKGADLIAGQIRKLAVEAAVPMVEAPLLARALFHSTDLNQPIPAALFIAVAKVLAHVFQLRQQGTKVSAKPIPMEGLTVPEELLKRQ